MPWAILKAGDLWPGPKGYLPSLGPSMGEATGLEQSFQTLASESAVEKCNCFATWYLAMHARHARSRGDQGGEWMDARGWWAVSLQWLWPRLLLEGLYGWHDNEYMRRHMCICSQAKPEKGRGGWVGVCREGVVIGEYDPGGGNGENGLSLGGLNSVLPPTGQDRRRITVHTEKERKRDHRRRKRLGLGGSSSIRPAC